jgi:hypothetical protein
VGDLGRPSKLDGTHLDRRLGCDVGLAVQASVVRGDGLLHVSGEVVPQMPAIRDLDSVRRTGTDTFGVGPGPIPTHHRGAGMFGRPGGERGGLAVG